MTRAPDDDELTVGEVCRRSGVSVRALHHYDEIGLLRPSGRSRAGYRLYGEGDLARLQQILFFRALDVPLEQIARMLSAPDFDVVSTLRAQREALVARLASTHALLRTLDEAIAHHETGKTMTQASMFEGFDAAAYEAEAEARWGESDAFRESKRRTARYDKADWQRIQAEGDALYARCAALMLRGVPADSDEARAAAEAHRLYLCRWFYDCGHAMHASLGSLYVDDPRFTANLDEHGVGLARYLRDAFHENAARQRG
jgi:MerR family transcriptional regulator, thiopeptide resistance regulator